MRPSRDATTPLSPVSIVSSGRGLSRYFVVLLISVLLASSCSDESPGPATPDNAPDPVPSVSASPPALRAPPRPERAAPAPTYRGLWVLCEGSRRVLEHPKRVDELIEHAQALGVTDLFVQVYRGGRAWFDSSLADPSPYLDIIDRHDVDPLARLIERAQAAGLRVHAWVNVLSLNKNRLAPILLELGESAVHVDRRGRSILEYPSSYELPSPDSQWYRAGTPGIYLDPGAPGVSERLIATFAELITRYPGLDGLHLDYIRHPGVLPFVPGSRFGVGLDFGYGPASQLRFRRETGLPGPFTDPTNPDPKHIRNPNAWDDWRRQTVTDLVAGIAQKSESIRPGLRISAAVISYADRAYLSLAQDWRRWLEDGLVDFVVPMVYSRDDRLFGYQVQSFASTPQANRIWVGVGVWLFSRSPGRAVGQLEIARAAGVAGDALFSYDSIVDAKRASDGSRLLDTLVAARSASAPMPASVPESAEPRPPAAKPDGG